MKHDRRCARTVAAALFALLFAVPAAAQFVDDGNEFRVNTTSPTKQRESAVAFSPDGGFAVVWRDYRAGITARFFPANRRPSEDIVLVENAIFDNNPGEGTIFSRLQPVLVYLDDGSFLLFWTEEKGYLRAAVFHYDYDVLEQDIYGQRFSAEGRPIGARFRVNRVQTGLQRNPAVAVGPGGKFLIAWDSSDGVSGVGPGDGVHARAFTARGLAVGAESKLDEFAGVAARQPALAAGRDGYLMVWEGDGDGTEGAEIFGRLLDVRGEAVGPQFRLNGTTARDQRAPAVAAGADGGYLAVWYSGIETPGRYRIFGQAVGGDGGLLGPELTVSASDVERAHVLPEIAASSTGEFLVGWLMWYGDFQTAVVGVHLDHLGNPIGESFRISQHQTSTRTVAMAAGPRGDYLVTWEGFTTGTRAEDLGIAARRIPSSRPQVPFAMPAATPGVVSVARTP
jgi:hypothetical protein